MADSVYRPAPYGRSCEDCIRTKSKCRIREGSSRCERCTRTNRECRQNTPKRRLTPARVGSSKVSTAETVELRRKLDEVLGLLKPGNESTPPAGATPAPPVASSSSQRVDDMAYSTNLPAHNISHPLDMEAESNLATFRTNYVRYLPFVCLPPEWTAQHLHTVRPQLWLCIMAITSKSTMRARQLSTAFRQNIAQDMVVNGAKSLDHLQALLVFLGWFNMQGDSNSKPSIAVFLELAKAAVIDLGLHQPPMSDTVPELCVSAGSGSGHGSGSSRTLEEHRAVLGCFLITSIMSSFLPTLDALRWTAQMRDSLYLIDAKGEKPTDHLLVRQVRLQLIVERITTSEWYDGAFENSEHGRPKPPLYLESLQLQTREIRTKIPIHLQSDRVLLAHLYNTEIQISNVAIKQATAEGQQRHYVRIKCLHECLYSIKCWFDNFFAIPARDYWGFSFSITSQFVHCLGLLYFLTTLNAPGWNAAEVQASADVVELLQQIANNMEQVPLLAGIDNTGIMDGDVFSRTAGRFRTMAYKWRTVLNSDPHSLPSHPLSQCLPINYGGFTNPLGIEWSDQDWLVDFSAMPNYYDVAPS